MRKCKLLPLANMEGETHRPKHSETLSKKSLFAQIFLAISTIHFYFHLKVCACDPFTLIFSLGCSRFFNVFSTKRLFLRCRSIIPPCNVVFCRGDFLTVPRAKYSSLDRQNQLKFVYTHFESCDQSPKNHLLI